MEMRFSLHSINGGLKEAAPIRERAVRAEQLGFEGVFLGASQLSTLEPFQVLATCAMKTERLKLGIAVSNMIYQDPTVLAGATASLSEISDGRAILGLGTGDSPAFAMGRRPTRLAAFEQGIRTIRVLLAGKKIKTPTGEVGITFRLKPAPVYLAMEGPRGLRLAGRVADGVFLGSGVEVRAINWARERIAEGAKEAGRSVQEITTLACGMVCIKDDGEDARAIVRRRLANRAHHNFRATLETVPQEELESVKKFMEAFDESKPMEERSDPALVTDYLVRRFAIAGTPRECIERLEELAKAGVTRVMLTPARSVYEETVERLAKEVMPAFARG